MQTIVLIMQRTSVAQGLLALLRKEHDVELYHEDDYNHANAAIRVYRAHSVLIEVSENGECNADYCLSICDNIKKEMPNCKVLLMCPEKNKKCIGQVVAAKQSGRIDNFVFYDASLRYLSSMLLLE
ncbi:MAG: hypothetical protein GX909_03320 [Clostridiaceae bacterium]|nr:hypothetical protein [Clostridiaceae bacterium]